eukprot:1065318-Pelagomonas_calceolata.AAC.2
MSSWRRGCHSKSCREGVKGVPKGVGIKGRSKSAEGGCQNRPCKTHAEEHIIQILMREHAKF